MASLLFQTIEQISREKHIEPEVIVAAIEDAMIVAARKFYKTEEELRAKFNPDSGQIDVFAVRPVVEEVTDPKKEFTLAEAKKIDPNAAVGGEVVMRRPTDVLGRIAAQAKTRTIAPGNLQYRRPIARGDSRRRSLRQGSASNRFPRRSHFSAAIIR